MNECVQAEIHEVCQVNDSIALSTRYLGKVNMKRVDTFRHKSNLPLHFVPQQ